MKVDIEDYLQQLIDLDQPIPTAEEVGLTKKQYEALMNKYDFSDEYGEFWK